MSVGSQPTTNYVDPDDLRAAFCAALSRMYTTEVPLYGDLVQLVNNINESEERGESWDLADRLKVERHGAIRLGKPSELAMIARLFRQMGMYPVGYYDLSSSGVPVHATAFRPISTTSLARNPFRVFTSLLRPELIPDAFIRDKVRAVLDTRDIFHPTIRFLVNKAEANGGLILGDAEELVRYALDTFRWHETALVDEELYARMKQCHPLLADIAGFKGPHINHLTPRVLDIDKAQIGMAERGITPKQIIEGPPKRQCAVLLRQTSFQALTEPIRFPGGSTQGTHRARFGEIESRGCALTPKGHDLYVRLMDENNSKWSGSTPTDDNAIHQARLAQTFAVFPDDWETIRQQGLAYFRYSLTGLHSSAAGARIKTLQDLISSGMVRFAPIVYEDFLPASAAGIFQSNLGEQEQSTVCGGEARQEFEKSLGAGVGDYWDLYAKMERETLKEISDVLGYAVGTGIDR